MASSCCRREPFTAFCNSSRGNDMLNSSGMRHHTVTVKIPDAFHTIVNVPAVTDWDAPNELKHTPCLATPPVPAVMVLSYTRQPYAPEIVTLPAPEVSAASKVNTLDETLSVLEASVRPPAVQLVASVTSLAVTQGPPVPL